MKRIIDLLTRKAHPQAITVVSGLPRSGTSLLMKMLAAGGLQTLTDNVRLADEDNPQGYYEYERVKMLPQGDTGWLKNSGGKGVKIITALLPYLPESHTFRVIMVERAMNEILMSQKKMLIRNGKDANKIDDRELTALFARHLQETNDWLHRHRHHITCLKVNYNCLLHDAGPIIAEMNTFLGNRLDEAAMARVIDLSLYRNRDVGRNVS
jgi:hypothetical protein